MLKLRATSFLLVCSPINVPHPTTELCKQPKCESSAWNSQKHPAKLSGQNNIWAVTDFV